MVKFLCQDRVEKSFENEQLTRKIQTQIPIQKTPEWNKTGTIKLLNLMKRKKMIKGNRIQFKENVIIKVIRLYIVRIPERGKITRNEKNKVTNIWINNIWNFLKAGRDIWLKVKNFKTQGKKHQRILYTQTIKRQNKAVLEKAGPQKQSPLKMYSWIAFNNLIFFKKK